MRDAVAAFPAKIVNPYRSAEVCAADLSHLRVVHRPPGAEFKRPTSTTSKRCLIIATIGVSELARDGPERTGLRLTNQGALHR